jgi:hypothetical protein
MYVCAISTVDGAVLMFIATGASFDTARQYAIQIAPIVRNAHNLKRPRLGAVDSQIRVYGKKSYVSRCKISSHVACSRKSRKRNNLFAYDGLHPIGGLLAAFVLDVSARYQSDRALPQARAHNALFRLSF